MIHIKSVMVKTHMCADLALRAARFDMRELGRSIQLLHRLGVGTVLLFAGFLSRLMTAIRSQNIEALKSAA